jgi:repressor LexA
MAEVLSGKRREILDYIGQCLRERGYPPSVREIGSAVGLASSATVHSHLAVLQREGYLIKDPTKPRAMTVQYDPSSGAAMASSPVRTVPLVGAVAAGTGVLAQENVEELYSLPEEFTGTGEIFMLKVRGESMKDAGILDGDYVVVRHQPTAEDGDIVVAGLPDEEATVKRLHRQGATVVLVPANESMAPIELPGDEVTIYGRVISVLRRL